jgi:hypothetical protein
MSCSTIRTSGARIWDFDVREKARIRVSAAAMAMMRADSRTLEDVFPRICSRRLGCDATASLRSRVAPGLMSFALVLEGFMNET